MLSVSDFTPVLGHNAKALLRRRDRKVSRPTLGAADPTTFYFEEEHDDDDADDDSDDDHADEESEGGVVVDVNNYDKLGNEEKEGG